MKYYVTFQAFNPANGRPIDHGTHSDFETDDKGFGMIPNVGDYVQIINMGEGGGAAYDGKVRSRLFRYFGGHGSEQSCGINLVIDTTDDGKWGEVIKE